MEIDQEMTMEEIENQFDSEWVLINDPVQDDHHNVLKGRVRFHSGDRNRFDEAANELGARRSAILYVGDPPKGMQFML